MKGSVRSLRYLRIDKSIVVCTITFKKAVVIGNLKGDRKLGLLFIKCKLFVGKCYLLVVFFFFTSTIGRATPIATTTTHATAIPAISPADNAFVLLSTNGSSDSPG